MIGAIRRLLTRLVIGRALHDPSVLQNAARITEVINTPYKVWVWGMYMVEFEEVMRSDIDEVRAPQDVVKQGRGNMYEIVDSMAFLLHKLGYKTIIVMSGKDLHEMQNHPTEYFALTRKGNRFLRIDNKYQLLSSNIDDVFVTEGVGKRIYGVFDWTGIRKIFTILPDNPIKYRLAEDFDPIEDMP